MTGTIISHYRVLEKLGSGGMGVVYRAEDLRLGRLVALKFLPENAVGDPMSLSRFEREARTASSLDHPNICTIYEIDDADGKPFIAMQLLEGETLQQRIAANPIPIVRVIEWAIQIADGLAAAHGQQIVHRDLKPANIFITLRRQAKILDFGLAKFTHNRLTARTAAGGEAMTAAQSSTQTGVLTGTIAHMSPEQARGEELDARSDIFSFGTVLYEMVTRRPAFGGQTAAVVFHAILSGTITPARELVPDLTPALDEIIRKALQSSPALRFQTASELVTALEQAKASMTGYGVANSSSETVVWSRREATALHKRRGRRRHNWIFAALLVIALAAALVWTRRTSKPPHAPPVTAQQQQVPANRNLAVLPIRMAQGSGELAGLGPGLVDGITGRLAQLTSDHDLQVAPAAQVRGNGIETAEEARKRLGANVDLAITLQQSGDLVRADWTVLDLVKGRRLKSGTVTAPVSDLFAIEDQIADGAVKALQIPLDADDQRALSAHGTESPEAYRYFLEGRSYLDDPSKPGALQSAATFLKHALESDPRYGAAEASLGTVYLRMHADTKSAKDLQLARTHCGKAIALTNSGAEGHVCLGMLATATGDGSQGVEEFRRALELAPSDDDAFIGLAKAYAQTNRPAEAEKAYLDAIHLRPQYWRPYNFLGVYYLGQAQYGNAENMFRKAASIAPESFQVWTNLGAVLLYEGNQQAAIDALKKSVSIYPTADAYSNIGTAFFQLKKYADAAQQYRAAASLESEDDSNWTNLADALYFAEEKPEAMQDYRRAVALEEEQLKSNGSDAALLSRTADNYSVLGERERALAAIHSALELSAGSKDALFAAAMVYNQLGDTDTALEWLAKALRAGYSRTVVQDAPALRNLHSNARYRELMRK